MGNPHLWMDFVMENPIKADDLGGMYPYFRKPPCVVMTCYPLVIKPRSGKWTIYQ